ncbi:hypothetical protein [Pontibacter anaerobius]|uniref:Phosphoribosylformylglycinamidine synthase n=1 Tax=Pontibacter anaerobius TaxID=2993940 RepID=A0ABT3RJT7_9BACT|nr:hypothetical protein [Pontibacter anaerobius]MCX2742112.1 hypothetical protein [Pontibacter anaerobius]
MAQRPDHVQVQQDIFGMMPHPERAVYPEQGNANGRAIFDYNLNLANA